MAVELGVFPDVVVSGDGRRAASISFGAGSMKVWDVEAGRKLLTLGNDLVSYTGVSMSGDGRQVVSASENTVRVWGCETRRELHALTGHFQDVAVSGDGRRAVSASEDGTLRVWDLESSRELRTFAVDLHGQWLVSASSDKTVKVWRLSTGEQVTTFTCDAPASCCAFSGHDRVVVGDTLGRVHFLSLELDERLAN